MGYSRRRLVLGATVAVAFLVGGVLLLPAAEVKFVTEYRYPTAFEVTPIGGVNGSPIGAVVTPTDFETREVGLVMSVYAVISKIDGMNAMVDGRFLINGNTRLMVAATSGDLRETRKQLKSGADVNASNKFGSTALLGAAAGGYADIVDELLAHRANVNARSRSGATPLIFASKNGHTDIVSRLVAKGAGVNVADEEGRNALMHAVAGGHTDAVKILLGSGARADAPDRGGVTPLMLAKTQKYADIVMLLTRAGGK